jgi:hypothetical protein
MMGLDLQEKNLCTILCTLICLLPFHLTHDRQKFPQKGECDVSFPHWYGLCRYYKCPGDIFCRRTIFHPPSKG